MMNFKKGCHALIVALIMAIFCNFIAFGDEVAEPAGSAVESVMDDTVDDSSVSESTDSETDEAAEPDSDSEPDGSKTEDSPEAEEKKDDDQSSFDSGKKEDHSSFDEWDFPEPEKPTPQPEPAPEPEKPEPTPKPEIPVVPVVPEPTPQPEPEKPAPTPEPEKPEPAPEPERWHDDDDDDDDDDNTIVVIPKMPIITETDEIPVIKTFEVSSGDTLPTPEEPVVTTEKASSSELPKTGDSSLALYAFLASAFGLVVLLASSLIDRRNADEIAKEFSAYPQMCCGLQETKTTGKDASVKTVRSSGMKSAPSRFGLRCWHCIEIVLALTRPGGGFLCLKIHPPHSRDFSRELGGWVLCVLRGFSML